jgi:hypothetical protein
MITIGRIAETIEAARRSALPGREASAVVDVMYQLRQVTDERDQIFDPRLIHLRPSRHSIPPSGATSPEFIGVIAPL